MKTLLLTLLTVAGTVCHATPSNFSPAVQVEEVSKIKLAFLVRDSACEKIATEKTWLGDRINQDKDAFCKVARTVNIMNALVSLRLRDLKYRQENGGNYVALSATRMLMKPTIELREEYRILYTRLKGADAKEFRQLLRGSYAELMSEEKMEDIENEIKLLM